MRVRKGAPTIYFIADHQMQAIKIGYSKNVPDRLSTLQTASARPLVLLGTMPGSVYDEQRLHRRFERLHGEWFRPTGELVQFIHANVEATNVFSRLTTPQPPRRPHVEPQEADETFVQRLNGCAYTQMIIILVSFAFISWHYILVPTLFDAAGLPESLRYLTDLFFIFMCTYGLTYRHAKAAQHRPPE